MWPLGDLTTFCLLAYLYSWMIGIPLALQAQGFIPAKLPYWLHYLTALGPALAALTISRRLPKFGARWVWNAVGALSPLALFAAAQSIAWLAGLSIPTWTSLGRINFISRDLGLWAWPLWFITSGFGEEVGWRGYALPRLQNHRSALAGSVVLGLIWAGWHLPAFFYIPSYAAMSLALVPGFVIGIVSGSIVLAWLYNASGARVLPVILWHASFNFVTASPAAAGLPAAIVSVAVIVAAVLIVLLCEPATLRWRSVRPTKVERLSNLPGDVLIADPLAMLTHAITIDGRRDQVWPWLVQMGSGRGGWYSYDTIDNGGHASATSIVPALQTPALGTVFPALPGATDGFILLRCEPWRDLVLGFPDTNARQVVTWAFVLRDAGSGKTRLIVRATGSMAYRFRGLPRSLSIPVVRLVHFIMERRQLLGIAARVETAKYSAPA